MDNNVLQFAIDHGIIDLPHVRQEVDLMKRQEILNNHPYKVWQNKNGQWFTYLKDGEKLIQRERSCKEKLEDCIVEWYKKRENNPTIKDVFDEWNSDRLTSHKIGQSSALRLSQAFDLYYSSICDRRMRNTKPEEFRSLIENELSNNGLTSKAYSTLKSITLGILRYAKRSNLISYDIDEIFYELDVSRNQFKKVYKTDNQVIFNDDEMQRMTDLCVANADLFNLGILLIAASGMRVGELVSLKPNDIESGTIFVHRTEIRYRGEDGKAHYDVKEFPKTKAGLRRIVIPSNCIWILDRLLKINGNNEWLFEHDGSRINQQAIRRKLYRNCDKLNIPRRSPHAIRRYYGTVLLDAGADLNLIEGQMGHTSIATTERHYHRNIKPIEKKREILNNIPEFSSHNGL